MIKCFVRTWNCHVHKCADIPFFFFLVAGKTKNEKTNKTKNNGVRSDEIHSDRNIPENLL